MILTTVNWFSIILYTSSYGEIMVFTPFMYLKLISSTFLSAYFSSFNNYSSMDIKQSTVNTLSRRQYAFYFLRPVLKHEMLSLLRNRVNGLDWSASLMPSWRIWWSERCGIRNWMTPPVPSLKQFNSTGRLWSVLYQALCWALWGT